MELRDQLQHTLGNAYQLERELGGGGMSRVFVSHEHALGRKVVVKVLPPSLSGGVNIERFKREIMVAARLQHAHIVPVLSAGETEGLPYYMMPYVDGESLRARLARGPLSISECVNVLRDVARALAYAHEQGVVHRDIKPDNIMLAGESAVVTDFGIAKAIAAARDADAPTSTGGGALTQLGTSLGTPAYMAPEQAAADPTAGHGADIYAFGCSAYEMLTGAPPFVEKTAQQLLAAHMARVPDAVTSRRPDTPPALADLVMRCLEKDAEARPASAREILRALDAVSSGGSHAAVPIGINTATIGRALGAWFVALVFVGILAKAATIVIGLPDWVVPGAIVVMLLGLPAIFSTWYVQRVAHRALAATPTFTPGGSTTGHGPVATIALKASPHLSWTRTRRGGFYAIGAFALLVAVFMTLRAFGIGPVGSLLASGSLKASDQILIASFTTSGSDSSLGGVLAEAMRSSLTQSRRVSIVQASAVAGALQRMSLPASTPLTPKLASEMAQREGFKAIVTGEVTPVGGGYLITARLVNASTGDVLTSYQQAASGPGDLIPVMDKLGRQLRGKIGESLRDVQGAPSLAKVSTPSIEALRKFTEGARATDVERNYPKAVAALKEAIAIDSNFAMAFRKLAIAANNGGDTVVARAADASAYALRDRIPEAERLAVEAHYFEIGPHRDRRKSIDRYTQLFQKYPEWLAIISPNQLANLYAIARDPVTAESLFALGLKVTPDESFIYTGIIRARINQGKFALAHQSLAKAKARKEIATGQTELYEGRLLYLEGKIDSAKEVARALGQRNLPTYSGTARAEMRMMYLREGGIAWWETAERAPGVPVPTETPNGIRIATRLMQKPEIARQRLDGLLARRRANATAPPNQILVDASLEAEVGRPERARALLKRFDETPRDSIQLRNAQAARHSALAWLAIAEGSPLEAVAEFRASDQAWDGPVNSCRVCIDPLVGLAFDRANLPDSAIAAFEHYLNQPDDLRIVADGLNMAWVLRRLGELHEAKGNTAKARDAYTRFVNLWKDADPVLQPQVTAIRAKLKRLDEAERRAR